MDSAYDEYAIHAFEVHAADYLLKPISRTRLEEAVRRVRKRITGQAPTTQAGKMSALPGICSARTHGFNGSTTR